MRASRPAVAHRQPATSIDIRLLLVMLALAVLTMLGTIPAAPPHLELERSEPEADSELSESPAEIRLFFTQTPEVAISRIALSSGEGEIELGSLAAGPENSIAAPILEGLAQGSYTVVWRTSSGDGHPIRGTFDFRVVAR